MTRDTDLRHTLDRFFAYARERYDVQLRREAGQAWPWTEDEILRQYRFTCVFREDDRVTRWFREHVRDPLRDRPEVLLATVLFRLFTRIETGEAMFGQLDMFDGGSAFQKFERDGDARVLRKAILGVVGRKGPYVTGAYVMSSPPGMKKLDGVLEIARRFAAVRCEKCGEAKWRCGASDMLKRPGDATLERAWSWFSEFEYLGKFHSYEIVTDLRHTALLDQSPDKLTWANPGPGARRGLNRIREREVSDHATPRDRLIREMQKVLAASRLARHWPPRWPKWELREVEHTLCEWDKYERARLGDGRLKRRYRP